MRLAVLLSAVAVAGCFSPSGDDQAANVPTVDGQTAAPDANATLPAAPVGERMEPSIELFALREDHSLRVLRAEEGELAESLVAEPTSPAAFYQSFAQGITVPAWATEPFQSAWESTGDIEITLSFMADAPAASANPKAAGFPAVGAWLGTTERFAYFLLAQDAPDSLEAGKVYTVTLAATPPRGGFFVAQGEQLALYTFLSYQTADGGTANYVIGGPTPSSVRLPHSHFNLSAPRATVILEESGELPPNPGPTGDMMESPPELAFTVPPDALYLVAEVSGAPKVGSRADIDLTILSSTGDLISGGSSPAATEVVSIGPGNLDAYGRSLVARITGSAIPVGATYSVKITAFSP